MNTMATQRAAGWPDWHPEDYCHRCGGRNASWHVDSDRFNAAMGKPSEHRWNGIICLFDVYIEEEGAVNDFIISEREEWIASPDVDEDEL